MQPVWILQIFSILCHVGAAALLPTLSTFAYPNPITSAHAPITTQKDLPAKRAENDVLIGSRTSDGKAVTSKCREGSTFATSNTFAGCIAPGEEIATTCAPNHQDTDSAIVDGALWCTALCFTLNRIYTAPSADPFTMMNCYGDYRLSRYVEATLTPINSATSSAGTATRPTTPPAATISKTSPPESPSNSPDVVGNKGLSTSDKITIGIGVPGGILTFIGTVATVRVCLTRRRRRVNRR